MPDAPCFAEPSTAFELRLNGWLRDDLGLDQPRRVVRTDDESVLVSKFEPGFAPQLHAMLDELPELFDHAEAEAAYARQAGEEEPAALRVMVWDRALRSLLAALATERGFDDRHQSLVRIGIDSVSALLDTVLWSGPTIGDSHEPLAAEIEAYRQAAGRLEPDRDLFTRYYGEFEDRRVVNHCPGAPFARFWLAQGWEICTATPPPEPLEAPEWLSRPPRA